MISENPSQAPDPIPEPINEPTEAQPLGIRYRNRYRMRVCESPFVIWFRERTGSTFLCSILNSHPDVLCRQEDFDLLRVDPNANDPSIVTFKRKHYRRQLKNFQGVVDHPTDAQTIDHFRRVYSQPRKACGFKFKFDIQIAFFQEIVDELYWMSRHVKVLLLTRNNFLKQAVSRQNMERIHKLKNDSNLRTDEKLPPIKLNIKRLVRYAKYMKNDDQRFKNSAAQFHNVKTVVYEEMLADTQRVTTEVMEFLGVDHVEPETNKVHKATNDKLELAVANYDELVEAVTGTELEQYLD